MRIKTNVIAGVLCVLSLAGCSQSDQKSDTTTPPSTTTSDTPAATSPDATTNTSAKPSAAGSGEIYEGTINGVISDSMCGKDHTKMGDLGKDAAACIKKCVASGAKYVLVDEKGDSYALSDQEKPKELAGKTVAVTGHIDPTEKSIHVHSIASK